jgi:hypothetical protein
MPTLVPDHPLCGPRWSSCLECPSWRTGRACDCLPCLKNSGCAVCTDQTRTTSAWNADQQTNSPHSVAELPISLFGKYHSCGESQLHFPQRFSWWWAASWDLLSGHLQGCSLGTLLPPYPHPPLASNTVVLVNLLAGEPPVLKNSFSIKKTFFRLALVVTHQNRYPGAREKYQTHF